MSPVKLKGVEVLLLFVIIWEISVCSVQGRECLEGFVSGSTQREKSALLGSFLLSEGKAQWISPYLSFTCPTTVSSFRIVAEIMERGDRYPSLQVWRPRDDDGTDFTKVTEVAQYRIPVNRTQPQLLHSVTLSVSVERGDVFGLHQPEIGQSRYILYFQADSGLSSFRKSNQRSPEDNFRINDHNVDSGIQSFPLVSVTVADPECVSGFLTDEELSSKYSALISPSLVSTELTQHGRQRRLIPGLSFGCTGMITSVTLTATQGSGSSSTNLQIWRRDQANNSVYMRQDSVTLSNPVAGPYLNTLTFSLSTPLEVEQEDVLGLFLPPVSSASYLLQFVQSRQNANVDSFPESYSLQSTLTDSNQYFSVNHIRAQLDYDLPLIRVKIDCGGLLPPQNGGVAFASTKANSLAEYNCSEGYIIAGDRERACQADNGEWSGAAPVCEAVNCGVPPLTQHGTVSFFSTTYLSRARYKCNNGFKLILQGGSETTCTSGGVWSPTNPVCAGIECTSLAFPRNGRVRVQMMFEGTQVGSIALYSCNMNYTLLGVSNRTCLDNESWTSEPPVCVSDCPRPPLIRNGYVTLSSLAHRTALHTIAKYTCYDGFMIRENMDGGVVDKLVCGENGEWIGRLPRCEVVNCKVLQSPEFGMVQMLNGTVLNSVAYYNCTSGYEMKGAPYRTCGNSGKWTGNEIICVPLLTTTVSSSPSQGNEMTPSKSPGPPPLSDVYLAIVIVIVALTMIILVMVVTITVLCVKRRKYKAMEMSMSVANLNAASLNNPVYEGNQRLPWNPNLTSSGFQFDSGSSRNSSLYEQPLYRGESDLTLSTREPSFASLPRPSLHYKVSSIVNPSLKSSGLAYSEPERKEESGHHYDVASNYSASQYTLPASPYEIPTLARKTPGIYGTIPWGSYVPSEEVRSSTSSLVTTPEGKTLSRTSSEQKFFTESEVYWSPACDSITLYKQLARNKYREILREQIQLTAHLGSGQFGTVDKGLWQSHLGVKEVAIKTLKTGSSETDKVKFLQEAAINGQFQHQNIVKLYGVVTMGEPVMIVLELLANGDLHNYLLRLRPVPGELVPSDTPQMLLNFCAEIAAGMEYLSQKAFIHRDLAARNILITKNKTCKIADFGLSRDLEDEDYYISHGGQIPVKWTAPEAIHYKKYSTASDVWSFGCVMYEIWSLGHKPFGGYSNIDTIKLIDRGFRLPPPPGCPREIYKLMIHCWHSGTSMRPTFAQLNESFHSELPHVFFDTVQKEQRNGLKATVTVLGGSLESSKNLYPELQTFYSNAYRN